ncbi:MAG: hypothetical protein ACRDGA_13450 [Bacteroidota bacterium]
MDELAKQLADIEADVRRCQRYDQPDAARRKLGQMLELIRSSPHGFSFADDRMRIIQARSSMIAYKACRLYSAKRALSHVQDAISHSTPTHCTSLDCLASIPPRCSEKQAYVNFFHKKMCVARLNATVDLHKIQAALAAKRFDHKKALLLRGKALELHRVAARLDPSKERKGATSYFEYWYTITEGCVAMLDGEFDDAKKAFERSRTLAASLNKKTCFPNYFQDTGEIATHEFYVNAIQAVKRNTLAS